MWRRKSGRVLARTTNDAYDLVHRCVKVALLEATLPDDDDRPAVLREKLAVPLVAGAVALELSGPEVRVGLGRGEGAVRAAVPEAPVDEDGHLAAGVADVRLAGGGLPVEAIAGKPSRAEGRAHLELGLCVLGFVRLHHMARRLRDHGPPLPHALTHASRIADADKAVSKHICARQFMPGSLRLRKVATGGVVSEKTLELRIGPSRGASEQQGSSKLLVKAPHELSISENHP